MRSNDRFIVYDTEADRRPPLIINGIDFNERLDKEKKRQHILIMLQHYIISDHDIIQFPQLIDDLLRYNPLQR
jgi:hypothetical protein